MADTASSKIFKDRLQENLRNRSQIDNARLKMSNYSTTDFAVGAGDELLLKIATMPAGTVLKSIATNTITANGATLVCTVGNLAKTDFHSNTFNLNAAGVDYEPATTNAFTSATDVYVIFGNSADVNASVLDFEVTLEFYYAKWYQDAAGLTS